MYNFSSQKIILLDPLEDRVPFNSSLNEYCFVVSFASMGRQKREREGDIYIYIYRVLDRGAFDRGSALPVEFQQFDSRER